MTREFLRARGLERNGTLELATPIGVRRFTIRGVLEADGVARAFGGRLVVMDLYTAQDAFAREGQLTEVDVVVDRGTEAEAGGVKNGVNAGMERDHDAGSSNEQRPGSIGAASCSFAGRRSPRTTSRSSIRRRAPHLARAHGIGS